MKTTVFGFSLRFGDGLTPNACWIVKEAIEKLKGVEDVQTSRRFPLIHLDIKVQFETPKDAEGLHRKVAKTIQAVDGVAISGVSTRLTDIYETDSTTENQETNTVGQKTKNVAKSQRSVAGHDITFPRTPKTKRNRRDVPFKRTSEVDTTNITGMGEFEAAPAAIVKRFGPPDEGDGHKVSGEYIFLDQDGEPFVVHDWKSTNLWDRNLLSPDQFWAMADHTEFVISSRDRDAETFKRWFLEQL